MSKDAVPRISVVIPVYNGARYLRETLASVEAQSESSWEVLLVDDGSTDSTVAIAEDWVKGESRGRCLLREHRGIGATRNAGVQASRGTYVAFLDADDLWEPSKLERQCERARPEALVFSLAREFASPELGSEEMKGIEVREEPQPFLSPSACLAPRAAFEEVGLFDESLQSGEFIDWYARAMDAGFQSDIVDEVLVRRRLHLTNHGRTHRADYAREYRKILRATIRRRREAR